jgi:hypothetical protein
MDSKYFSLKPLNSRILGPFLLCEELNMEKIIDKAKVLIEALPYIRRFYNKTIVIKYGEVLWRRSQEVLPWMLSS